MTLCSPFPTPSTTSSTIQSSSSPGLPNDTEESPPFQGFPSYSSSQLEHANEVKRKLYSHQLDLVYDMKEDGIILSPSQDNSYVDQQDIDETPVNVNETVEEVVGVRAVNEDEIEVDERETLDNLQANASVGHVPEGDNPEVEEDFFDLGKWTHSFLKL